MTKEAGRTQWLVTILEGPLGGPIVKSTRKWEIPVDIGGEEEEGATMEDREVETMARDTEVEAVLSLEGVMLMHQTGEIKVHPIKAKNNKVMLGLGRLTSTAGDEDKSDGWGTKAEGNSGSTGGEEQQSNPWGNPKVLGSSKGKEQETDPWTSKVTSAADAVDNNNAWNSRARDTVSGSKGKWAMLEQRKRLMPGIVKGGMKIVEVGINQASQVEIRNQLGAIQSMVMITVDMVGMDLDPEIEAEGEEGILAIADPHGVEEATEMTSHMERDLKIAGTREILMVAEEEDPLGEYKGN
ncbi:hypothetical protein E2562_038582 [Oryza meyeriana var. granulata]|uniref:Uncharacterized protein n=1 Tax=Oryza meyeriana var. granulata TaxID=110450 RepID=A0A6G1DUF2_9ORYZ|nr:hypothetical protein E2562_038582 [Oryza meyeriana var. granulata]